MPKKAANNRAAQDRPKVQESSGKIERPQWPKLQPLVPAEDLSMEVKLDDQIFLIHRLFTSSLSRQYINFLSTLPLVTTPGKPKKGDAVRVNDRYQIDDPDFANLLWASTPLKDLVTSSEYDWGGEVVGLNPNIRIYRYSKGQFFDQHYDDYNLVSLPTSPPTPARTTWTLLIYLTGPETGCEGGETAFYPEDDLPKNHKHKRTNRDPIIIAPEVGMALLHKHGNDCLLHEGKEVTQGEKWIIRSDLCVRR